MARKWMVLAALVLPLAGAQAAGDESMEMVRARMMPMAANHPADLSDSQLQAFGDAIGDARVVALAEQTHGGRQEFELKTRLLRYLHERKGFDVLLLESGVFDVALLQEAMKRGEKLDALAPGNVFYMYAKSDAGRGLLRYLDEQQAGPKPLLLSGIDSQLSGGYSRSELLPRLRARLQGDAQDWPLFARLADRLMQMNREPPTQAEQQAFDALAGRLRTTLCVQGGRRTAVPQPGRPVGAGGQFLARRLPTRRCDGRQRAVAVAEPLPGPQGGDLGPHHPRGSRCEARCPASIFRRHPG